MYAEIAAAAALARVLGLVDIGKAVALPPAAEVGEHLRSRVKKRLEKIGKGAAEAWRARGIEPQLLPDSFTVPFLQGASIADDPALVDLWTGLVANAADPGAPVDLAVQFVATLRVLSPVEARLLEQLWDRGGSWEIASGFRKNLPAVSRQPAKPQIVVNLTAEFKGLFPALSTSLLPAVLDHLQHLGLVTTLFRNHSIPPSAGGQAPASMALTDLGAAFLRACKLPNVPGPTEL